MSCAYNRRRAWHEGMPYILGSFAVSALLARRYPGLSLASAAFGAACTAFFRDPDIQVVCGPADILSAADGTVMQIDRVLEPWWIGGEADRVAVFLSLFDAHVNRFPVEGRLVDIKRVPGAFEPAFRGHSENNCRDLLALEGNRSRLLVVQISGILARRSVQWCQVGDRFEAGERLGMIRFGSRTDIYIPAGDSEILVKTGDRVHAGRSLIARYKG